VVGGESPVLTPLGAFFFFKRKEVTRGRPMREEESRRATKEGDYTTQGTEGYTPLGKRAI